MSELDLTAIAPSSIATPAAGVGATFFENTGKYLASKDDAGAVAYYLAGLKNSAIAAVGPGFAADTYVTGSSIPLGTVSPLKVGTRYYFRCEVLKTAAGVGLPVIKVRIGTNGNVADASILSFSFDAGTAAIDAGIIEIFAHMRIIGAGATAVMAGVCRFHHELASTGLTSSAGAAGVSFRRIISGGFDSTVASQFIGVSINAGASASWTMQLVQAEVIF